MFIHKTHCYRLVPTAKQVQDFARYAGCCRFVYNHGLAARQAAFRREGRTLTFFEQCNELPRLKRDSATKWLMDVSAQVLQQALRDLQRAYDQFFRRVKTGKAGGYPRFRKKGQEDSFRYPQGVRVRDGCAYLPKIGWVKYRDSRPLEGVILQTTIKREGRRWFIYLACRVEVADPVPIVAREAAAVGIDVGLANFAVLSDGTEIANPRFLKKDLEKIRKAQRRLSRKVRWSNNWRKQREKVLILHAKIRNSRKDFAHKSSTAIVKSHDVIAVEDLYIPGMLKNRRLSRAISDAGWGMFLAMLKYKAEWRGKVFLRVDRFLPTTQTCSRCGDRKSLDLSTRTYSCGGCGLEINRDLNASLNIRAAGLAALGVSPNACGGHRDGGPDEARIPDDSQGRPMRVLLDQEPQK